MSELGQLFVVRVQTNNEIKWLCREKLSDRYLSSEYWGVETFVARAPADHAARHLLVGREKFDILPLSKAQQQWAEIEAENDRKEKERDSCATSEV